jgi:hypothetical protein
MILLDLKQSAAECSVDESTLLRWTGDGVCPPPILVDGLPRWVPAALERWAADGCPASEPLHYSVMNAIRRGQLEDMGRRFAESDRQIKILEEMENDEL